MGVGCTEVSFAEDAASVFGCFVTTGSADFILDSVGGAEAIGVDTVDWTGVGTCILLLTQAVIKKINPTFIQW